MTRLTRGLLALIGCTLLAAPASATPGKRTTDKKIDSALRLGLGPRQEVMAERLIDLRRRGQLSQAYLDGALGTNSLRFLERQAALIERSGKGRAALPALRAAIADLRADHVLGGKPTAEMSNASRLGRYRFSEARYLDLVRALSGDRGVRLPAEDGGTRLVRMVNRRLLNRDNQLGEVRSYLKRYYASLGLEVKERFFNYGGRRQANLEVIIPGASSETIVLGAHYDTAPDERARRKQPSNAMSAAPGADDNASGTAGLMEAARALRGLRLQKTVRLVHFTGEEKPYELGSRHFVKGLRREHVKVSGAIILDAIGLNRDGRDRVVLHSNFERGSLHLAGTVAEAAHDLRLNLRPVGHSDQSGVVGVKDSDSGPFVEHDIPAIFVCEDFRWRIGLHDRFDTVDKIDPRFSGRVVTATVEAVARLAGAGPR
jgi:hypothetical protein